jgi:hypothetical protein
LVEFLNLVYQLGKINKEGSVKINFFSDFTQLNYVKIVSYKVGGEK